MANTSPSANMSLPIPVPGVQSGPQYAININDCLTIIDQHTHTPGSGVPITSAALNINADLSINGNNLTSVKSVRMSSQSTTLVGASDLGCLYQVNSDLYYNDGSGTPIRMTQNSAVAGTPGSIANLASPASASYVSAASTFVFQSDVSTPAYLDSASILIRNLSANSKALTLEAPAAMGADFTLTLPSLPAAKKIVTLDSAGAMQADYDVDNSSLEINSNLLRVKDGGITSAMLASGVLKNLTATTFTSNGSWTCPTGVTQVIVHGCGGGGGGGGGSNANSATAGGGGGGVTLASVPLTVVPGTIYAVTIGAGGTGGAGGTNVGNGSAGGTGGTTSLGSLVSFFGATGGAGGVAGAGTGGAGGVGLITGGTGGSGTVASQSGGKSYSPGYLGGAGGSQGGGGGAAGVGAGGAGSNSAGGPLSPAGSPGTGYGSGGGGSAGANAGGTNGSGGAGAPGILIITYVG